MATDREEEPLFMPGDEGPKVDAPKQQLPAEEGADVIDLEAEEEKYHCRRINGWASLREVDAFLHAKYAESFEQLAAVTVCNPLLAKELDQVARTVLGGNCTLEYLVDRDEESWASLMQRAVEEITATHSKYAAAGKKLPNIQLFDNIYRSGVLKLAWKHVRKAEKMEQLRETVVLDVKEWMHKNGRGYKCVVVD